ncbi:hypothetical protein ACJZ2D_004304 [Fusarium nematophilum]
MRLSSNHPWPYDSSAGSPATDADEPKPESFVSSTPVPDPSNHGAVTIPNTAIENSFRKGLLSFSWTIHILAVGAAMAVVQFSLRSVYWFDEGANVDVGLLNFWPRRQQAGPPVRRQDPRGPDLGVPVRHGPPRCETHADVRRRLLGPPRGSVSVCLDWQAPLGRVLEASVRSGEEAQPYLCPRPRDSCCWRLADPYGGGNFTTYVAAPYNIVYSAALDEHTDIQICLDTEPFWCPAGGYTEMTELPGSLAFGCRHVPGPQRDPRVCGRELCRCCNHASLLDILPSWTAVELHQEARGWPGAQGEAPEIPTRQRRHPRAPGSGSMQSLLLARHPAE